MTPLQDVIQSPSFTTFRATALFPQGNPHCFGLRDFEFSQVLVPCKVGCSSKTGLSKAKVFAEPHILVYETVPIGVCLSVCVARRQDCQTVAHEGSAAPSHTIRFASGQTLCVPHLAPRTLPARGVEIMAIMNHQGICQLPPPSSFCFPLGFFVFYLHEHILLIKEGSHSKTVHHICPRKVFQTPGGDLPPSR